MAKSGGRKRRPQGCSLRSHRLRRLKPLTPTLSPATHSAIPSMLPCCTSDLKRRFISRNWRGEYPLAVSYWVFGFLSNLIIIFIVAFVTAAFKNNAYDPRLIFTGLSAIWLSVSAVVIWQFVGVWRSANRHIEHRIRMGKRAPWAGLAKLAVILGVLRLVADFGTSAAPQLAEASRMAFLNDPDLPPYSIRIMRNGTEAEITGGIKFGLTDDFLRILRASQQVRVLHIDSIGGRIGEAGKLNKAIRDHGLITYVSARCYSACTVAFAGGRERWLRKGAKIGFHAPTFPGMSSDDIAASDSQREIFSAAGFASGFITKALATPNKDLWTPSIDELLQARVVTAISDGSNFAASGYGAKVNREKMASELTKYISALKELKERFLNSYNVVIDAYYNAYLAGQTEKETIAAARAKLLPIISAIRAFADDAVLVELGRVYAFQYSALRSKDATLCYIPRSRHDPKILWVDDAEIVGDRITKVRPIPRNLFTQKTERRIGELGASCVALVVSDVSVHEAP